MKHLKRLIFITLITIGFSACSNDDDSCVESTFYQDLDNDGLGNPEVSITACSTPDGYVDNDGDNDDTQTLTGVVNGIIEDLHAPQAGGQGTGIEVSGNFTLFDLDTQSETTSTTDWDIAFRGTVIVVNGGGSQGTTDEPERTGNAAAYIVMNTFDGVTNVDTSLFVQDAEALLAIPSGSGNGWYNYTGFGNPNPANDNLINPIAGRVMVFRTTEGRHAKVRILSYYLGNPQTPNGFSDEPRYYTFEYTYQPNNNVTIF